MVQLHDAVLEQIMQVNHAEHLPIALGNHQGGNGKPLHLFNGFRRKIIRLDDFRVTRGEISRGDFRKVAALMDKPS